MNPQMTSEEIEEFADQLGRKQQIWRAMFVVVLLCALAAVIAFLTYSNREVRSARQAAIEQKNLAAQANKDVNTISAGILSQLTSIDQEARVITGGEDPLIFIWKGGIDRKTIPDPRQRDPKLLALVNTRRYLIGSITKPMLESSPLLDRFACLHRWFVIGKSAQIVDPDQWLRSQTDPRFGTTFWVSGSVHPAQKGLVVGVFLTSNEADKLEKEVDPAGKVGAFKKTWDFGGATTTCVDTPESQSRQ